jgi:hypothetical protein
MVFYWDDNRGFINYTVDFLKRMYQIDLEQWMLREKLQILEQTLQMLENFRNHNNINGAPETAAAKF